jgi:hypothetical protein
MAMATKQKEVFKKFAPRHEDGNVSEDDELHLVFLASFGDVVFHVVNVELEAPT